MKLNLPLPGHPEIRLLFSNVGVKEHEFYLLMTFHKSKKGGFHYPVTVEDCKKALKRKCRSYVYVEPF